MVRHQVTFLASFAFVVCAPSLHAQFDLFVAQVADGAGFFSQIAVNNPGSGDVSCTFSTFDDAGNPLELVYDSGSPAAVSRVRRTKPLASATAPASSINISIPPGATALVSTSGQGDGTSTALAGSGELNCSAFVIGGVTYWYARGSDVLTGIGVPAVNTTTAFRVDGGNRATGFAFYNPSQANTLQLTVEAFDGSTGAMAGSVHIAIPPNGHIAFNAGDKISLASDFFGSFRVPSNGQQFVPLALGVADTNSNVGGFLLFSIPSFSGQIVGID